jgi:ElaB/YqjD/DUF883 family membrane-anchored ribosome-binding protein
MEFAGTKKATIDGIKAVSDDLLEQAADVRERLSQRADEALRQSRRALNKLQDSAEDALDETKVNIRKRPFESVAIAVGAGALIGLLIGYAVGSTRRDE